MTAVVAVTDGTVAWMGCDSAVSDGDVIFEMLDPLSKIVKVGKLLIGMAGSLAVQNLVRYDVRERLEKIESDFGGSDRELIYVIDRRIRASVRKELGEEVEYSILYALPTILAESNQDGDLYFGRVLAIGSGYQYALGALSILDPQWGGMAVEASLESSCKYSPSCNLPIGLIETKML